MMTLEDILEWFHERGYEVEEVRSDVDGSFTISLNGVFAEADDADDENKSEG